MNNAERKICMDARRQRTLVVEMHDANNDDDGNIHYQLHLTCRWGAKMESRNYRFFWIVIDLVSGLMSMLFRDSNCSLQMEKLRKKNAIANVSASNRASTSFNAIFDTKKNVLFVIRLYFAFNSISSNFIPFRCSFSCERCKCFNQFQI